MKQRKQLTVLLGMFAMPSLLTSAGQAVQLAAAGCSLQFQDHYLCNREALRSRLAAAHTVQVSVARMELFAEKQMKELVGKLGKDEAAAGSRPDLIFELSAVDRSGRIDFGPADLPLATLTVYEPLPGGRRRLWVETFDGQQDRPWPGTVIDLIRQFRHNALEQ